MAQRDWRRGLPLPWRQSTLADPTVGIGTTAWIARCRTRGAGPGDDPGGGKETDLAAYAKRWLWASKDRMTKGVKMLRHGGVVLCAVALLTGAASGGELRYRFWPANYVPQELVEIPVVMDVGYWVHIVNQDDIIKLQQMSIRRYEGCLNLDVRCNFSLRLSCSVAPTGAIGGQYSCSLQGADIDPPRGIATVCAQLDNPELDGQPGGSMDVHVATVTLRVVPR